MFVTCAKLLWRTYFNGIEDHCYVYRLLIHEYDFVSGLGFSMCCISFICTWYSGLIMAWTLCYLFYSFYPTLPWSTCDNAWNTDNCVTLRTKIQESYNVTNSTMTYNSDNDTMTASETVKTIGFYPTAANEFWR